MSQTSSDCFVHQAEGLVFLLRWMHSECTEDYYLDDIVLHDSYLRDVMLVRRSVYGTILLETNRLVRLGQQQISEYRDPASNMLGDLDDASVVDLGQRLPGQSPILGYEHFFPIRFLKTRCTFIAAPSIKLPIEALRVNYTLL